MSKTYYSVMVRLDLDRVGQKAFPIAAAISEINN